MVIDTGECYDGRPTRENYPCPLYPECCYSEWHRKDKTVSQNMVNLDSDCVMARSGPSGDVSTGTTTCSNPIGQRQWHREVLHSPDWIDPAQRHRYTGIIPRASNTCSDLEKWEPCYEPPICCTGWGNWIIRREDGTEIATQDSSADPCVSADSATTCSMLHVQLYREQSFLRGGDMK